MRQPFFLRILKGERGALTFVGVVYSLLPHCTYSSWHQQLKKETIILAHGFRSINASWWGIHGGAQLRVLVMCGSLSVSQQPGEPIKGSTASQKNKMRNKTQSRSVWGIGYTQTVIVADEGTIMLVSGRECRSKVSWEEVFTKDWAREGKGNSSSGIWSSTSTLCACSHGLLATQETNTMSHLNVIYYSCFPSILKGNS